MTPHAPDQDQMRRDIDDLRRDTMDLRRQTERAENIIFGRPGEPGLVAELGRMSDRLAELRTALWVMIGMMIVFAGSLAAVLISLWSMIA